MKSVTFLFLSVFMMVLNSAAVAKEEVPAVMQETPASLQFVMDFEGSWLGDATMTAWGESFPVDYNCDFRLTPDGTGIIMDEVVEADGNPIYTGTNLIGYDYHSNQLVWFTVDNEGHAHSHYGELIDENHLFLKHEGTNDGLEYIEDIDVTRLSDTEVLLSVVITVGGEVFQTIDGTFVRQ